MYLYKVIKFNPDADMDLIAEPMQEIDALIADGYAVVFTQAYLNSRGAPRIFVYLRKGNHGEVTV